MDGPSEFLLEPDVVFLNHGSFGACPRVVHETYQRFQSRLEAEPVRFLQRELPGLLANSRRSLAEFIGAEVDDVVFVPNPTFAVNEIIGSLDLGPGDEVLVSDHEYGACMNAWIAMSQRSGFEIIEASIELPIESDDAIVEQIWSRVTGHTKVIFLSQITSPTALTVPVGEICRRAAQRGIMTLIDGAHVAGQLPLDVKLVGADFYVGTCHKWLCAPKGSAFFYCRSDMQHLIEPLIVGWGCGPNRNFDSGSDFLDHHEWLGTDDPAAYLTVPAAIEYQREHDWPTIQKRCHDLAVRAVDQLDQREGFNRVHPDSFFAQMALIEITQPKLRQLGDRTIQTNLYDQHRIEIPIVSWQGRTFARASFQAYNNDSDVDALENALTDLSQSSG